MIVATFAKAVCWRLCFTICLADFQTSFVVFIISEFGGKVVPPKRILKMLPELFDHQDQNVRASSKGLTLELCRWIGKEPVKSILFEKMRDTMVREMLKYLFLC